MQIKKSWRLLSTPIDGTSTGEMHGVKRGSGTLSTGYGANNRPGKF
jgi:hypothetical protein